MPRRVSALKPALSSSAWASSLISQFHPTSQTSQSEGALPIILVTGNATLLGTTTLLTATLTPGTRQPLTYSLDFGDGTPIVQGVWSANASLPLSHTYSAAGSYAVVMTTINTASLATVATIVKVIANNALLGTLTSLGQARLVTYTLIVTNTSAWLSATQIVLSGSVPAQASLVDAGDALTFTTGGDFGNGYVQSPAPITLLPNQCAMLSWVVELPTLSLTETVVTQGYVESGSSTLKLALPNTLYRGSLYLPVLQKRD